MRSRKGKQTLPAAQQDHPRDKLDSDGDSHDVDDHDGRILQDCLDDGLNSDLDYIGDDQQGSKRRTELMIRSR